MNHQEAIEAAGESEIAMLGPDRLLIGPDLATVAVRAYLEARSEDQSFVVLGGVINVMAAECAVALLTDFGEEA